MPEPAPVTTATRSRRPSSSASIAGTTEAAVPTSCPWWSPPVPPSALPAARRRRPHSPPRPPASARTGRRAPGRSPPTGPAQGLDRLQERAQRPADGLARLAHSSASPTSSAQRRSTWRPVAMASGWTTDPRSVSRTSRACRHGVGPALDVAERSSSVDGLGHRLLAHARALGEVADRDALGRDEGEHLGVAGRMSPKPASASARRRREYCGAAAAAAARTQVSRGGFRSTPSTLTATCLLSEIGQAPVQYCTAEEVPFPPMPTLDPLPRPCTTTRPAPGRPFVFLHGNPARPTSGAASCRIGRGRRAWHPT